MSKYMTAKELAEALLKLPEHLQSMEVGYYDLARIIRFETLNHELARIDEDSYETGFFSNIGQEVLLIY